MLPKGCLGKSKGIIGIVGFILISFLLYSGIAISKTTISFLWNYGEEVGPTIEKLIEQYQKENPEISINLMSFTGEPADYAIKLISAIAAGTPPDVFQIADNQLFRYAKMGVLDPVPADIEENIKEKTIETTKDLVIWEMSGADGVIYGVPWVADWVAMWYNKDMFEEAGIPGPPANWKELIEYAKKLTKYDSEGNITRSGISLRVTGHLAGITDKFTSFITAAGGDFYNENYTRVIVNSPAGLEAVQLYLDLLYKYKVDAIGIPHDAEAFANRKTAMFERGPWVYAFLQAHAPELNFGIAPVPDHTHKAKNMPFVDAVTVAKESGNKDVAWNFVRWLALKPENRIKWVVAQGVPPLFKNEIPLYPQDLYKNVMKPFLEEALYLPPKLRSDYEVKTIIGKWLERIFYRKVGAKEGLDQAAKEATIELLRGM